MGHHWADQPVGVPGEGTEKEVEKPSEKIMQVSKLDEANESHIQGAQMNSKYAKSDETYTKTHYRQTAERQWQRKDLDCTPETTIVLVNSLEFK